MPIVLVPDVTPCRRLSLTPRCPRPPLSSMMVVHVYTMLRMFLHRSPMPMMFIMMPIHMLLLMRSRWIRSTTGKLHIHRVFMARVKTSWNTKATRSNSPFGGRLGRGVIIIIVFSSLLIILL